MTNSKLVLLYLLFSALAVRAAAPLRVDGIDANGTVRVSNAFTNGAVTLERAALGGGSWTPVVNAYSPDGTASVSVPLGGGGGFLRATATDFTGDGAPWTFGEGDVLDAAALGARFWPAFQGDDVSDYLRSLLSTGTQNLLAAGPADAGFAAALIPDLNAMIGGPILFDAGAFPAVALSPVTLALLDQNPTGEERAHLNRLLLEDAYPGLLRQKREAGFLNFVHAYGALSTVAGSGNIVCAACNSWDPSYEGALATDASLSSPHIAMADRAGNVYIADKRAHAIRKVLPDGHMITVAGTGIAGLGDTNPAPATTLTLNNPNGLWVLADGSFYILDRDNGLIRKVDAEGILWTVVDQGGPIPGGRGLWVSADESQILYAAGTQLMQWDRTTGLSVRAAGFANLGNIATDPQGRVVVTDSDRNLVTRLESDGSRTVIAGNGLSSGGGDGFLATQTGLYQVRAICFLPTGAFLLGTDSGAQVWYVDLEGHIHLLMNGTSGNSHTGDGAWFYDSPLSAKLGMVKQITLDYSGDLLITESVQGYVRRVRFFPGGL